MERCCDLWHQCWVAVEYHSSMSRAVQPSGRCGHGISHSGCLRGASLSTDWQQKVAGFRSLARTAQRRVATVTLHTSEQYPNESVLVSHVAVPRKRASLGEVSASGCPRTRLWLGAGVDPLSAPSACRFAARSVCVSGCQRRAYRGKRKISCSSRCRLVCQPPTPPLNSFDQDDAEPQYEEDQSQNDIWQAAFDYGDEGEKSALFPHERAHGAKNIPQQWCHSLRQTWEKHAGEPKATSRSSWEPVEAGHGGPQENNEPRNPTVRPRVASPSRRCAACWDGCGESSSASRATLCLADFHLALWRGGPGRGLGEGWVLPSGGATLPYEAACCAVPR